MTTLFLQITEPPSDFLGFLLWFVAILVGVVATMFYFLKAAMQARIDDRDATILQIRTDKERIEAQRDKLITDFQASFTASTEVLEKMLEIVKK